MPSFCLPCSPTNASSHFDEPEQLVLAKKSINPQKERNDLGEPTSGEYASEAGKQFVDVLLLVAEQIPFPGVSEAVKIARNIIQACDDTHATLGHAEELKLRIKGLLTVLVGELKGKKSEEVQEKLQADIQTLSADLTYIQQKLNDIASQNALLLFFFRSLNDGKVNECVGRLNNSLENFSLVRQINDATLLNSLEKGILDFHAEHQKSLDNMNQKVDDLKDDVKDIKLRMTDIKHMLSSPRDQSEFSSSSPSRSRSGIPVNTDIIRGRDALVAELVHILTSNVDGQKRPRVCLLGSGGMGKTSTALAVMAHSDMERHFCKQNQVWVPCVKATSHSLFLDTLYASLGATQNSGDMLTDIISEINLSPDPIVLLLDNFETPWNMAQSETEQILCKLDEIGHLSIFVTMRSLIPPCNREQWQSFKIEEVDEKAAQQIYLDICSTGSNDAKLSELLKELGHMPLAINLMANMANLPGFGVDMLIEEYRRIGPSMLGQGMDAKHNLNICIQLSVESPPMKNHPEACELLATLALLPIGASYPALKEWWVRKSLNLMVSIHVLTQVALIQQQKDHYFVLPVIRSYLLDSSHFPSDVHVSMIALACNFLQQHKSSLGDSSFKEHASAISAEEGNLQAILLNTTDPEPSLIQALLILAKHRESTRPRLEVIEHAVKLASQMDNHQILYGETLNCFGNILNSLDHYDKAVDQLTHAHEIFLSISSEQYAAQSSLDLVNVYFNMEKFDFETKMSLVEEARSVFERLDDVQGIALSFYYLGLIIGQDGDSTQGIEFLSLAKQMFQDQENVPKDADCSYNLSLSYYWDRKYDDALTMGKAAVEAYEHLGKFPGSIIVLLSRILFTKKDYSEALKTAICALEASKAYGSPGCTAESLETIGRIWEKMNQKTDALGAYAEALEYYGTIPSSPTQREAIQRCEFLIRQAENPLLIPTDDERETLALYNDF